jgi:hypothetical protein
VEQTFYSHLVDDPVWGVALPCCALCGRPLEAERARWVVLDHGLGFALCPTVEGCEPLRVLIRTRPERFQRGLGWRQRDRPLRIWPATVSAVDRTTSFDDAFSWRLGLDVAVVTIDGRTQVRAFGYVVPTWTGDPRAVEAFRAVLGREPDDREVPDASGWVGRSCGVVLDWSRNERGRQVVWVSELRPPG